MKTFFYSASNCFAKRVDNELEVVVLPTPPLPPTKIQCNVLLSSRFYKVPGKASSIDLNKCNYILLYVFNQI